MKNNRFRFLYALSFLLFCLTVKAQKANEVIVKEIRSAAGFIHPGIGCTAQTLEAMREGVRNGQSPWVDYFIGLRRAKYAALDTPMRRCEQILNNGGISAFTYDAHLAWTHAIIYIVTGNEDYRRIPLELIKWYGTRTDFFPRAFPDSHIKMGNPVYQFCAAAEIMRYTTPKNKELVVTKEMLADFEQNSIRPIRKTILENKGYFMNQHSYSMVGYLAATILADDMEGYKDAVEMATVNKDAPDQGYNGSIKEVFRLVTEDVATGDKVEPHIQLVEMGRDQAHAFGNLDNLNIIARTIDLQETKVDPVSGQVVEGVNGVSCTAFLDDRILKATEIFSRYNMGFGIDWTPVFSSTGRMPVIYRHISPEYRGRIDMNGFQALYYTYRGLGYQLEDCPAFKASVAIAMSAQRDRIASGEFINTLHNGNFHFFMGLSKEAALGKKDLQKAQMALSADLPNYNVSSKGIRQIEDRFVDLSGMGIKDVFYPHTASDVPLEVTKEGERTFVRMALKNTASRTMVNMEGSVSCPIGKTGILLRSDAPVRIDLYNGEDYGKKDLALDSLYVPDTKGEWRYIVFERLPEVITFSKFGFSTLLYFNVHPLEGKANVDFDLFNSNENEINPIQLNVSSGVNKLFVCPGEMIEKKFQDLSGMSEEKIYFSAQGLPEGATLDENSGVLSWKPLKKDVGAHKFYVMAENGVSSVMVPVEVYVGKKDEVIARITVNYAPKSTPYVSKGKIKVEEAIIRAKKAKGKSTTDAFKQLQEAIGELQFLNPWLLGEEGSLDYTKTSTCSKGLNIFVYSSGDNYDCSSVVGPQKEFVLDFGEGFTVGVKSIGLQSRANFPDRVRGTVILGSNDNERWNLLTEYPAGTSEDMQIIPVKPDEKMNSYRYLKIYMPSEKGLPGLLDIGELRIYGERFEGKPL